MQRAHRNLRKQKQTEQPERDDEDEQTNDPGPELEPAESDSTTTEFTIKQIAGIAERKE